ncbi:MAG: FAD-binding oxidoreductase [Cyclobacteriaceae bacterium]|nr:FAD-binding oxidoreductase [Cyclobacteriaceae bacterium]UYN87308.1 MAG: FAD-binding oxidoreductase [Cyclobacteriaceae bacterium]
MALKKADYIIVGQGLAGSCLALQLLFRKKRVLVIDRVKEHSATRVAAGLFNPITGRQMVKTWLADELFPYLHTFYPKAENFLASKFFFPMPLYRPFISVEEQNEWMGRSADSTYSSYFQQLYVTSQLGHQVKNPYGGLLLKQCGYVDTSAFTNALRDYLRHTDSLLDEDFAAIDLKLEHDAVVYKDWQASRVIFCTGDSTSNTPYFSWLPIKPLKGETLTLATDEQVDMIYNRGVYVVPTLWKAGATYNIHDVTPGTTEAGRIELMVKLRDLIVFPYTITNQHWGFRPTTPDRRPILGPHPVYSQIVIFNGLGTKGVSLAPYFSDELTCWMENGQPINQSVSVSRYKSLYSKSA